MQIAASERTSGPLGVSALWVIGGHAFENGQMGPAFTIVKQGHAWGFTGVSGLKGRI